MRRLGCAAALLLAGCATTRFPRPEVATPAAYRGETAAEGGQSTLGELAWRDLIGNEELAGLIEEALGHNLDVQMAAARVLEARAQFKVTRAARFPALDGQAGYTSLRSSEMNYGPLPPGSLSDLDYTTLSAGLGWELDVWGRLRNLTAAARAGLLATEFARQAVRNGLASDVAAAYFRLLDLDLEVAITRRARKLREESLELVRLRVDNGYSSEIDLRQAEVLVKTALTELTSLELEREQTENALSVLLGRNPGAVERRGLLGSQKLAAKLPAGLPSALLGRRPDIRQAEEQLRASEAEVRVARAAYFPAIALTASAGFESPALRDLFRPGNGFWQLAPAAGIPGFHAGRIGAGVRRARARREQALVAYRQTVQQAFREVADGLAGSRQLSALRAQQEGLVESLRQAVELADLRYQGGIASYLEYLDSERQLLDAELGLAQVRRQELTNTVTLYRALGGGWK
jgi:multidrug efflux system outer membrane protein